MTTSRTIPTLVLAFCFAALLQFGACTEQPSATQDRTADQPRNERSAGSDASNDSSGQMASGEDEAGESDSAGSSEPALEPISQETIALDGLGSDGMPGALVNLEPPE